MLDTSQAPLLPLPAFKLKYPKHRPDDDLCDVREQD